jgi:predicted component of type VI protein secretion system
VEPQLLDLLSRTEREMPLSAKLVVVGGEVKSAEIKLRLPSTIGRGRGATIMLPHPLVSRQHCELFETNGRLMVRDLGSLNGTFVNNERISEAALPPGELLTVGAVTFRAVYSVRDASAPPEGPGPHLKSGHSRDTDPNGTIRAAGKPTVDMQASDAPSGEPTVPIEDNDFNFEIPVTPVDEGRPTDRPAAISETKSDATEEVRAVAEPAPAQPVPPSHLEMDSSTFDPPSKNSKADFSKWDEETGSQPAGHEDDDFGDFLKSLETK